MEKGWEKMQLIIYHFKLKHMDYNKHTDEVLERLQAQQILEILATANKSITQALASIQELEHNSMMYLDMRPTQQIMDDINALHLHLHFLQSAKTFAKNEIQEIGFYLN
jgi:hypothetical protein